MGEFDLIRRFFTRPPRQAVLGVGDDCALWSPTPGMQLALSADLLVAGRHFLPDVDPEALGHKTLAVNLSDLAACGAQPRAFLLSLALPEVNEDWLAGFARGLLALADAHGCELVGGDTTRGPLTLNVTVMGEVPPGQALLRSGAQVGDDVYVSGHLGDARLWLEAWRGQLAPPPAVLAQARARMERPTPRVALGLALRQVASSAADLSDGLLGDLGHILKASGVGAELDEAALPALMATHAAWPLPEAWWRTCVLAGGDDYELVFTAAPAQRAAVQHASAQAQTPVHRIGRIGGEPGVRLRNAQGDLRLVQDLASFDHFA